MTTVTKTRPPKRKVVKGIEHGLSGYTNYGCRCDTCTEANTEHSKEYRDRRFAGNPLCAITGCQGQQSRAYSNGLCWPHAREISDFRKRLGRMDRLGLRRFIRENYLDIRVLKRYTEDDLRAMIESELGLKGMAEAA